MSEGPVTRALGEFKSLIVIVILLAVCFFVGWYLAENKAEASYRVLLKDNGELTEHLLVADTELTSLSEALKGKDAESEKLRETIRALELKPPEVKYIIKTRTVIEGAEPKIVTIEKEGECEPLPPYLFKFKNGLPVASFRPEEQNYIFETFDVTFDSSIVISDEKTAVLLEASSSHEPDKKYNIPLASLKVIKIRDYEFFEPHLALGATTSVQFLPVGADITAFLSTPLLHPREHIDLLAPKILFNDRSFRLGVDIISYNIGTELPIITDLWLGFGTSIGIGDAAPSLDLSISSKF